MRKRRKPDLSGLTMRGGRGSHAIIDQGGWLPPMAERRALGRLRRIRTVPSDEVAQQAQPRGLTLLGMKLHGEQVAARYGAGEGKRIPTVAGHQGGIRRRRIVAVHEVEAAAARDPVPQRVPQDLVHFVPAHVRHLQPDAAGVHHALRRETHYPARQQPEARRRRPPRSARTASAARCRCRETACCPPPRSPRRASPRASNSRMQSGIAPWPGNTTRRAARTAAGSP